MRADIFCGTRPKTLLADEELNVSEVKSCGSKDEESVAGVPRYLSLFLLDFFLIFCNMQTL